MGRHGRDRRVDDPVRPQSRPEARPDGRPEPPAHPAARGPERPPVRAPARRPEYPPGQGPEYPPGRRQAPRGGPARPPGAAPTPPPGTGPPLPPGTGPAGLPGREPAASRGPARDADPGHGHGHGHGHGPAAPASRRVQLLLAAFLVPCALASLVGVLLLYPFGGAPSVPGARQQLVEANIAAVTPADCSQSAPGQSQSPPAPNQSAPNQSAPNQPAPDQSPGQPAPGAQGCVALSLMMTDGPAVGRGIVSLFPVEPSSPKYRAGDKVVLQYGGGDPTDSGSYQVADFQRSTSLWVLGVLFAGAVILLGRWRGVAALVALGVSFVVLIMFMLPAILDGRNPLAVALVGACLIMFAVLYLSHGLSARTSTAVLGTLVSLGLIGVLSAIFTGAAQLTGLDDSTQSLIAALGNGARLDPRGLLLAGFVIGALGVLDDVTVTQTSAVWELRRANPLLGPADLFAAAMRIGRDHISSAVNTLVLAYAGAALPLLLFFSVSGLSLGQSLSAQDVASELVRTLVGSIGLVASVPITTGVAALVASREPTPSPAG